MEFINGTTMLKVMKDEGIFNEQRAAKFMASLFSAINHCHSNDVIHRDIKPENIMVDTDGELRLIDFGMSKSKAKNELNLGETAGSALFMAPEAWRGTYS